MSWSDFTPKTPVPLHGTSAASDDGEAKREEPDETDRKAHETAAASLGEGTGSEPTLAPPYHRMKGRRAMLPPPPLLLSLDVPKVTSQALSSAASAASALSTETAGSRPSRRPAGLKLQLEKPSSPVDDRPALALEALETDSSIEESSAASERILEDRPLTPRSERLFSELMALGKTEMAETLARLCGQITSEGLVPSGFIEHLTVNDRGTTRALGYTFTATDFLLIDTELLGRGQFKEVFLAVDVANRVLHAIGRYINRSSSHTEFSAIGTRAADTTPGLREKDVGPDLLAGEIHPNIVESRLVRCGGQLTGLLVMPLLSGGDMESFYPTINPAESREKAMTLLHLFADMARGIDFLAGHNIIHGDLKASNFVIERLSDSLRAKVSDLDSLRTVDRYKESAPLDGRTIRYMAPECGLFQTEFVLPISLEGYDPRKEDVFALGLTLYTLITGSYPKDFGGTLEDKASLAQTPSEQVRWRAVVTRDLSAALEHWALPEDQKAHLIAAIEGALEPDYARRADIDFVLRKLES